MLLTLTSVLFFSTGLHHWAADFLAQDDRRDEAIVLIDPDFLFLKIFEFPENTAPVLPGKPAAAKYGLGGQVRMCSSCSIYCLSHKASNFDLIFVATMTVIQQTSSWSSI